MSDKDAPTVRRILVLENDSVATMIFKMSLVKAGFKPDFARSVDEAMELFEGSEDYEIVAVDYHLGDNEPTGELLVSRITERHPERRAKVTLVSTSHSDHGRTVLKRAGCDYTIGIKQDLADLIATL